MSSKYPISAKGIVLENEKVWLRKNERNEGELPGGRVEEGEEEETVKREIKEELGFEVKVIDKVSSDVYRIEFQGKYLNTVRVISYLCKLISKSGEFELNGEAGKAEFNKFSLEEVKNLNMPDFYKKAILKSAHLL